MTEVPQQEQLQKGLQALPSASWLFSAAAWEVLITALDVRSTVSLQGISGINKK
ncbi:MAG: hypothetical protein ABIN94_03465 [Ferruginibacter sp.]